MDPSLKDRIGLFAANEMIKAEKDQEKFNNACKSGNYQMLKKMCFENKFTFGDALVTCCKYGIVGCV